MSQRDPFGFLPSTLLLVAMVVGVYALTHIAEPEARAAGTDRTEDPAPGACVIGSGEGLFVVSADALAGLDRAELEVDGTLRPCAGAEVRGGLVVNRSCEVVGVLAGDLDGASAIGWRQAVDPVEQTGR